MKKFIIPIAIAVALGIGSGIAAVTISQKATAEKEVFVPEFKSGRYYLNGDVESGLYLEVTEDHISLRGDDVVASFEEAIAADDDNYSNYSKEEIHNAAAEYTKDYSAENPYVISVTDYGGNAHYAVLIHWTEPLGDPKEHRYGGNGYWFNGTDTLNLDWFGDFILVDGESDGKTPDEAWWHD